MWSSDCEIGVRDREQSKVLLILLSINVLMFFVELCAGLISDSTALIADSLDMFADATVYGISLYVVGKSFRLKAKAAQLSGIFQIVLGLGVAIDILRRWLLGSEPDSAFMIGVGVAALVANVICLRLIGKHRAGEVHMRASWVFSKNDVLANLGVIVGGILVYSLNSQWPDLIIGALIAFIVIRGGIYIVKEALAEKQKQSIERPGRWVTKAHR